VGQGALAGQSKGKRSSVILQMMETFIVWSAFKKLMKTMKMALEMQLRERFAGELLRLQWVHKN